MQILLQEPFLHNADFTHILKICKGLHFRLIGVTFAAQYPGKLIFNCL
jgi:hypothetical protein